MTKDGMKDKISMALKDPILQMGFEVICSKLSRLEKENAELKEKISVLLSCKNCPENKGGWICEKEYENKCLTQKIVYIKELKEDIAEHDKQLTKAKELIKEMLSILPKENIEGIYEITEEAEQFLSEVAENEN